MGIQSTVPTLTGVALVLFGALPGGASATDPIADDVARQAREIGVPGGALVRLDEGAVAEVTSFGGLPVDARYLWGSVSKPVAATVVRELADDGRVDLAAPVSHYVERAPDAAVGRLLDHTAGVDFGAQALDVDRPRATARSVAQDLPPVGGLQQAVHRYSSLGFVYVQAVVESATGGSYEQALRDVLPGTGIGVTAASCADVVTPHRLVGPWAVPAPHRYDGAGAGYAYTCGSIRDLAAFAQHHLADPDVGPVVPTGHPGQGYAAGWRVSREPDGRTTHWHTGTVPGYFSALYLDPASGDGVGVLLDASGYLHEEQLAALTRAAYDRATGRPVAPPPTAPLAQAPLGLVALAAAVLVLALAGRWRSARARVGWAAACAAVAVLVGALVTLGGYPPRYLWLWEPGLVVGLAALALATLTGLGAAVYPTMEKNPTTENSPLSDFSPLSGARPGGGRAGRRRSPRA